MKLYPFQLACCVLITFTGSAQKIKNENQHFQFYAGTQIRVTPIYIQNSHDILMMPGNIFQQPDQHLSGTLAFEYGFEKELFNFFSVKFSHSMRYGFLYSTQSIYISQPNTFKKQDKKAIISDVYFDIFKKYNLRYSSLKFGLGISFNGLGTNYLLTQRFIDNNNQSYYISTKENFEFPATSFCISWQKNKFNPWLRMGYCWNNPTAYKDAFLFPELGIQYQLFSF